MPPEIRASAPPISSAVRIEDSELCPRYTARVIQGVKVGPSPEWLRDTLEKVGVRSISNVVDVTNYVMLETGQPLHAFDYHLLAKAARPPDPPSSSAALRPARSSLPWTARSARSPARCCSSPTNAKAVALAGIMGGQNSEINPHTLDVLLESAFFEPRNIRATSKRLDLRTESSYRFERGARHRRL